MRWTCLAAARSWGMEPKPFRAATAVPPEVPNAFVTLASLKWTFQPRCSPWRMAVLALAALSFVSCNSVTSAAVLARICRLPVLHAFGLAVSTVHSPECLGGLHPIWAASSISWISLRKAGFWWSLSACHLVDFPRILVPSALLLRLAVFVAVGRFSSVACADMPSASLMTVLAFLPLSL